jgi:hypothetical protein
MRVRKWARLHTPARCGLRWGAWYPVVALTPQDAQLWVRGRPIKVARSLLELRSTPPREWTVVRITRAGVPDPYLVCPSCRHRAPVPDVTVTSRRCPRCNELFAIAWDDGSHEARARDITPPPRDELRPDYRMARRRMPRDRRNGHERRDLDRRSAAVAVPCERRQADRRITAGRRSTWDRRLVSERRRRVTNW